MLSLVASHQGAIGVGFGGGMKVRSRHWSSTSRPSAPTACAGVHAKMTESGHREGLTPIFAHVSVVSIDLVVGTIGSVEIPVKNGSSEPGHLNVHSWTQSFWTIN